MNTRNKIFTGNALDVLKTLPDKSINLVMTSPPYYGLRSYGSEPVIWGGEKDCKHGWANVKTLAVGQNYGANPTSTLTTGTTLKRKLENNELINIRVKIKSGFCLHCGAWKGELGLEPTVELYIEHLIMVFDEVWRVLRDDGTCWVNLGDSYYGGKGQSGHMDSNSQDERFKRGETLQKGYSQANAKKGYTTPLDGKCSNVQPKSLLQIPSRFAIAMTDKGWILRNEIIWFKRSCMPESTDDRFTRDFEKIFFFVKSSKTLYWTNEKTLQLVTKQPAGTKGIENVDWEWRDCNVCNNKNYFNYRTRDAEKKNEQAPQFRMSNREKDLRKQVKCLRCKGTGIIKYNLWSGHDYYFEQQFEKYKEDSLKITKINKNNPKDMNGQGIDNWLKSVNPLGRNKRCVWDITAKGTKEKHYASYPQELCETPIKAGCPEFVCSKCGMPRVKIFEKKLIVDRYTNDKGKVKEVLEAADNRNVLPRVRTGIDGHNEFMPIGYATCSCNAELVKGIVLDPFGGTGTTGMVAQKLNRDFVLIDIIPDYNKIAVKKNHNLFVEL